MLATLHRQQAVNNERLVEIAEKTKTIEANHTKLLDAHYADAIPATSSSPANGASRPTCRS